MVSIISQIPENNNDGRYHYISFSSKPTSAKCGCQVNCGKMSRASAKKLLEMIPLSVVDTCLPNSDDPKKDFAIWLSGIDKHDVVSFLENFLKDRKIEPLKDIFKKIPNNSGCNACGAANINNCTC